MNTYVITVERKSYIEYTVAADKLTIAEANNEAIAKAMEDYGHDADYTVVNVVDVA